MIQTLIVYESDHFFKSSKLYKERNQDTMQRLHQSQTCCGLQTTTGGRDGTGRSVQRAILCGSYPHRLRSTKSSAFYQCIPVRDRFLCFLQRQQIGNTNKPITTAMAPSANPKTRIRGATNNFPAQTDPRTNLLR